MEKENGNHDFSSEGDLNSDSREGDLTIGSFVSCKDILTSFN